MINKDSVELKNRKTQQNSKKLCAIIIDGDEILLIKDKKHAACNLFEFPKRELLDEESKVSNIFNEMKGKYGIKGKTKDKFICNILHSYKGVDLNMDLFEIHASKDDINICDELVDVEWHNVNQIWNKVPLAPADVTVAQILLEFNEN